VTWANALLILIQAVVAIGLLYQYLLLFAGGSRRERAGTSPHKSFLRFAIAIPAHNEAMVIGATVARLRQMDYPPELFDVHVVADHCDDDTASVARVAGAFAHERQDGPRGRKGFALEWLLNRILDDAKNYDAIVVFDADSQVMPDFLSIMDRALAGGASVVQGHHRIVNPSSSIFATLADADMRLNNRMRNQAKENLVIVMPSGAVVFQHMSHAFHIEISEYH
jgi:cellulose synthase/poly-beta-1,6-N-acetylglucosamine synthase-like glycosyltransferase